MPCVRARRIARRAGLLVLPLYGDLPPAEQDRAIAPAPQRKVILATNVAESSMTVEGVTAVIDSGLARIATYSQWTGLPTLHVGRVSKASAKQRAGRAGRTGPGRVLRLYSVEDYLRRPEHDAPEIPRSDLSQLCLALRAMRISDIELARCAAARRPSQTPSRCLIVWAPPKRGPAAGAISTASSSVAHSHRGYGAWRGRGRLYCRSAARVGRSLEKNDLLAAIDGQQDYRTLQQIEQLRRIARPDRQTEHDDDALLMSVLAGFPDRVARRRTGNQVLLSAGGSAEVAGPPARYEFMVAVDAEDRKDKPLPLIRMTARIEPEWLIELFPDRVREHSTVEWNRPGGACGGGQCAVV